MPDRSDLTVGQWLDLLVEDPPEAGAILEVMARRAAARVPHRRWDDEDAAHDAEVCALNHGCAALRRVEPLSTPLLAWLRGCVRNLRREKEKEKEKERDLVDDLPNKTPGPLDLAEIHEDMRAAIALLDSLPPPHGYALYLRVALDMTIGEIRDRLNEYGPVGLARVARILVEADEMLCAAKAGDDLRQRWPHRYAPGRNRWIGRNLPPLLP